MTARDQSSFPVSRLPAPDRVRPWAVLYTYLKEGRTAVTPLAEGMRRANSHRNRGTALPDMTTRLRHLWNH